MKAEENKINQLRNGINEHYQRQRHKFTMQNQSRKCEGGKSNNDKPVGFSAFFDELIVDTTMAH